MTVIPHRDDCLNPRTSIRLGEHGDVLDTCAGCGRFRVVNLPEPEAERQPEHQPHDTARYRLACLDCPRTIWLHRRRPTVPLCRHCRRQRAARKPSRADA